MAYTIVKTDGTILTTIPDGTINVDSTSLGLPGRYFAGYGQSVDTNFVHVLENFANSTPPQNPIRGQLWYNTNDSLLYVCPQDGETNQNAWVALAVTSTTATSTFGGVIVTGNIEANNFVSNNSITGNSITVNYANVNVEATMSSANIYGNANIANVVTQVITTGSSTTTGIMTGTWTVTGGAVGNTLVVNGGNLFVASGVIASSFTFPNGTPISPTGGYTNQNVSEYLQGTGNITVANRFQGNIFPNFVTANAGVFSGNITSGNISTNTISATNVNVSNLSATGNVTAANGVFTNVSGNGAALTSIFPSQGGNSGKYLKTNGTTTLWDTPPAFPTGGIIMWSGSIASIPSGWALCDGTSGTPDLRNRFVIGAGSTYAVGATGGSSTVTLTTTELPSHSHSVSLTTSAAGGHTHTINDPGHSHTLNFYNDVSASGVNPQGTVDPSIVSTPSTSSSSTGITVNGVGDHTHTVTGSTSSTGSGAAFSILPPYYALAFIMKL